MAHSSDRILEEYGECSGDESYHIKLPENKYVEGGEYGNYADNQQSRAVTPHHDFPLSQPIDYHPGRISAESRCPSKGPGSVSSGCECASWWPRSCRAGAASISGCGHATPGRPAAFVCDPGALLGRSGREAGARRFGTLGRMGASGPGQVHLAQLADRRELAIPDRL
jgi:hypothetical protein